jgi:hypothetical protein
LNAREHREDESGSGNHMIAKIIIGAFATLALLVGFLVLLGRIRMYTRGVRAIGKVVAGDTRTEFRSGGPPRRTHAPVIEALDTSTNELFTFRSSFAASTTQIEIGGQVPVRYVPGDHDLAEVDRLAPMWFFPVGTLGFSGLMFWVLTRI